MTRDTIMMYMAMLGAGLYVPKPDIHGVSYKTEAEKARAMGLHSFEYEDGIIIYAINRKNADRKHKQMLAERDVAITRLIKHHSL